LTGNWAFTYGTLAYFHGAIDRTKYDDYSLEAVTSLGDIVDSINGINGMCAEETTVGSVITVHFSKGNRLYVSTADSGLLYNVTVAQSTDVTSISMSNMLFTIYPNDPQDSDKYKLMVQPDDGELFYISLYDGEATNSYTVSLVADALDQTGGNAFIENLNALDTGFTFKLVIIFSSYFFQSF
jgi:hypothetical protein